MVVYTEDYIQKKLEKELEATFVSVEDMSDGCGAKFNAIVVTPKFEGVSLLQRHRYCMGEEMNQKMVNEVLKEEMNSIHAFTQKTLTPEQWEKQKPAKEGNMKCEGLCQTKNV